jgi:hypothetical protein
MPAQPILRSIKAMGCNLFNSAGGTEACHVRLTLTSLPAGVQMHRTNCCGTTSLKDGAKATEASTDAKYQATAVSPSDSCSSGSARLSGGRGTRNQLVGGTARHCARMRFCICQKAECLTLWQPHAPASCLLSSCSYTSTTPMEYPPAICWGTTSHSHGGMAQSGSLLGNPLRFCSHTPPLMAQVAMLLGLAVAVVDLLRIWPRWALSGWWKAKPPCLTTASMSQRVTAALWLPMQRVC